MRQVRIVIRYYNERGEIVFEGTPTLGHAYRVPLRWTRWEIYWDEALMESGERMPGEDPAPGSTGTAISRKRHTDPPASRGRKSRPMRTHHAVGDRALVPIG